MSSSSQIVFAGSGEAHRRIAHSVGGLRVVRVAHCEDSTSLTPDRVSTPLVAIRARIEVVAKLHDALALSTNGNGVNLGVFLQEISELIDAHGPEGNMRLTVRHCCDSRIDPRHALKIGLIAAELLTNAGQHAHPTGLPVRVQMRCETRDG